MRDLITAVVLILNCAALAHGDGRNAPVVCVSAVPDSTGKAIGPLGDLNDELARDITKYHKPLQGAGVPTDINGRAHPNSECDYRLEITLHVGGSTGIVLNPPKPNPYDPGVDTRRTTSEWLVRASYRLTSTPRAGTTVKLEDSITEQYEPNVVGYGKDLATVAKQIARTSASNAAGRLKKKLKL